LFSAGIVYDIANVGVILVESVFGVDQDFSWEVND
jgi:hypothetical protein